MDAEMVAQALCPTESSDLYTYDSEEDGDILHKTPPRVARESTTSKTWSSTLPSRSRDESSHR